MNWFASKSKAPEGLIYIDDFLTEEEQKSFVEFIEKQEWDTSISRRTQHYGHRYNYQNKGVSDPQGESCKGSDEKTPEIPEIFDPLLKKLTPYFDHVKPDQMIINEYTPGKGIGAHIDHLVNFGPVVASISLLSTTEMEFRLKEQVYLKKLKPLSAVILTGPSRLKWTHAIKPRNVKFRRISLTFRTMAKQ